MFPIQQCTTVLYYIVEREIILYRCYVTVSWCLLGSNVCNVTKNNVITHKEDNVKITKRKKRKNSERAFFGSQGECAK